MKVTFITNACAIYESNGYRLLSDPWLTDGAFEGSWYHYPPLQTSPQDLLDVNALYISHLHPDHYDPETLQHFRRDIPIVILDRAPNYLARMLRGLGFTNLTLVPPQTDATAGPFKIRLYAPFAKHPFDDADMGNAVDSAMLISDNLHSVLNANDNTLTLEWAQSFKDLDLVQLNYNPAGPYPACFEGYRPGAMKLIAQAIVRRSLEHLQKLLAVMRPRYFQPFAGAFCIAGKMYEKNIYAGVITAEEAADYVQSSLPDQLTAVLGEGDTIDLCDGQIAKSCTVRHQSILWAGTHKRHIRYPYEDDPTPSRTEILELLPVARENLWRKQEELGCFPNCWVYIDLGDRYFRMQMNTSTYAWVEASDDIVHAPELPMLMAVMDDRLLRRILTGESHWNNVEVGMHISFLRVPDVHQPDVHTLLSFFHVPREAAVTA